MEELFDEKTRKEIEGRLAGLAGPVTLIFFTQEHACTSCTTQRRLLEAVAGFSGKLSFVEYDLVADAGKARELSIARIPATAVIGAKDDGIRFYGVTGGYEFGSLLEAILMVSRGASNLSPEVEALVRLIDVPVHLEVMVTLTCPYCPKMVHLAHQLAVANEAIRADMVESSEFPTLVQRYRVAGVPRTVINEGPAFEGALSPESAVMEILKAAKPAEYERIDARMREERGERAVAEVKPGHEYDVIIVGAGPAALSASIYAVRKNLDTALLGETLGGQITNTASIENWLGVPEVGGQDLAHLFRDHAERYPVAERLGVAVTEVKKAGRSFRVLTKQGESFRAKSVIYCAGKEYRRLGVPGESRFIGRGIAFCATCDAPLYRDKRVAVVGGGNSAFTAARDLLGYARELHIINIVPDFQADPVLVEEVAQSPQVTLHPSTRVLEFLGQDELAGVRIASAGGGTDLAVEGVFLEIGLVPNTKPVETLLPLNGDGEIPVNRDQSTSVPGFFAAGDVTDEAEKQIVVAAGAGARAALAAHRYLMESKRGPRK